MFKRFKASALIENKIYFSLLISFVIVTAYAEIASAYVGNNAFESAKTTEKEGLVKSDSDIAEGENFIVANTADNNENQPLANEGISPPLASETPNAPSENMDLTGLNSKISDLPPIDVKETEEKNIEKVFSQKIVSTYDNLKSVSENIIYLKTAQKTSEKNKSTEKLSSKSHLAVKETIKIFETSLGSFAKIYYAYSTNYNTDESIKKALSNHIYEQQNYLSERLQLEVSKLQNIVSKNAYLIKKHEIDEKYIALKIRSNLSFDLHTVNTVHLLTIRALNTLKEDEKILANLYSKVIQYLAKNLENSLVQCFSLVISLYSIMMTKKRDRRESEQTKIHAMLVEEFKKRISPKDVEIEQPISYIIVASNEEIIKYGSPQIYKLMQSNSKFNSLHM